MVRMKTLVRIAAVAALGATLAGGALAQGKYYSNGVNANNNQNKNATGTKPKFTPRINGRQFVPQRGNTVTTVNPGKSLPVQGNGSYRGPYGQPGYRGGYYAPGVIYANPNVVDPNDYPPPPDNAPIIDNAAVPPQQLQPPLPPPPPPSRQTARRNQSGAPPANERRMVPDEVVIELANTVTAAQVAALQQRHRLTRLESQTSQLSGTTMYRWRIPDRRSVATVVRLLEQEGVVASAQPNYLFSTRQSGDKQPADNGEQQYLLAALHLPQAHDLAKGDNVLVAVIDSGIDAEHPELAGSIAESFDTLPPPLKPDNHGTAIAGLIAAHGKLTGSAPNARILAIHAFNPKGDAGAEGTTFNVLKGLDWAAEHHARIVNMSFAGPSDPAIRRALEAAHKLGIVLIAAAGNAGPKSPPLYPAADAHVIAVSATDADDKLFALSNRGAYIAVSAPGADILVAIPDGAYEVGSGTSYSAAEVSGIVALMLERKPDLTPDKVRAILMATAKDLGPKGRDNMFGAGLADAYAAIQAEGTPLAQASQVPLPVSRASTRPH